LWNFWNIDLVLVTLINWLLKPKFMLIHIFEFVFVFKYDFYFYFWETWPYAWKKIYFFFNVLTKTGYFNTRFVSLQYNNTNQYWSKCSKLFLENHRFFWYNWFLKFWKFFNWAGLGPTILGWVGAARPSKHWIHSPMFTQNNGEWNQRRWSGEEEGRGADLWWFLKVVLLMWLRTVVLTGRRFFFISLHFPSAFFSLLLYSSSCSLSFFLSLSGPLKRPLELLPEDEDEVKGDQCSDRATFSFFPSATVFIPALFFFFISGFLKWQRQWQLVLVSTISSVYILSFCSFLSLSFFLFFSLFFPFVFFISPRLLSIFSSLSRCFFFSCSLSSPHWFVSFSCFYRPKTTLCW